MSIDRRLMLLGLCGIGGAMASGCANGDREARNLRITEAGPGRIQTVPPQYFQDIGFSDWSDAEPEYVLYPGDEIEIATPTASELTRTQKIGPDGRISLPLVGQIMAADRTIAELEADASAAYASQLRRPVVEVTLKTAGPLKVWVDGQVRTPGVYDMPGDIDAWQAVIQAGGFTPSAKRDQVALVRRGPGGSRMLRAVDLSPNDREIVALRRGDIVFVPLTVIGEVAEWVTQFRLALPIGFSYAIGGQYQSF
ncbi:polysaccharide biosynthesis/export family protein [Brevundimonas lenta]|uniref:Polysaccharide export outer membrane protein n=1 Tax=Brevundimonas lenta TaxID=424796 RepID=A0A7W6NPD4_9CAUL|nr:polysaccharide biosynthesis/export family protein [Brevundimonas lenta]MBB4083310.1 polysaccharide export outer membrane protein [Brevundimonas lenta]